jgi:hypothetical protein
MAGASRPLQRPAGLAQSVNARAQLAGLHLPHIHSRRAYVFYHEAKNESKLNILKHMKNPTIKPTGCCEIFNPEPWNEKEITWADKLFVKDHVTSFFHIPLNMGSKIIKNIGLIEKANAKSPYQLMLTDEKSLWGSDIYIDVAKEVPGAQMARISGTFLTKVFEGPYQNAGKWAVEMREYVKSKGKELKKMYFSYTTCPKCAKAYGKNYVVLFAQIN